MSETFIKEVIDGEVIEIKQITVRHILRISIIPENKPYDKLITLLINLVIVNGTPLTEQTLLDWTNIKAYSFCSDAINRMISGLNI